MKLEDILKLPIPSARSRIDQKRTASFGEDDFRWTFMWPYEEPDIDALLACRKEAIQRREYWLGLKSSLGRFAKDCATEALKDYRGACLAIGWALSPDDMGDCPAVAPYDFSEDLHRHICYALSYRP